MTARFPSCTGRRPAPAFGRHGAGIGGMRVWIPLR